MKERADRLFSRKSAWDSRNQDIADHFYVERADFTVKRDIGDEYADHLVTGYPSLTRRNLGDSLGAMLRPKAKPWFKIRADREEDEDHESKEWLEWATGLQRRAMYDKQSMFTRAAKEGDHDFATFGGAAISVELNRRDNVLLYRCWHLRDMAWAEDSFGQINIIARNWKPTVRELCSYFGESKLHQSVLNVKDNEPDREINVRHIICRSDEWGAKDKRSRWPWVSMFIDCENNHLIEDTGSWTRKYVIPRWATVSGSAYPYSPAALIALPDARLIQAMTLTMLDAGERAANPPMIGVAEAIRGDVQMFPGGFTSVDAEYDERLGEVLRPMTLDKSGLPFGLEMLDRQSELLREAFYLNTLSMPPADGPEMTAYEVGQRVQEYIRNALPLFEPMEDEYNGELCDITFETLLREGAFGSPDSIPDGLQGADVKFDFESPLHDMIEREKGQQFLEAKAMIAQAAEMDPSAPFIMDFGETLRDVLGGIGSPTKWLRSPEEVKRAQEETAQAQQAQQALQQMETGASVAEKLGRASESFQPQTAI